MLSVQRGTLRPCPIGSSTGGAAGELGPLRVPARSRHVISLRGEWRRPDELTEDLPSWLPRLELAAGEPLQLSTPDLALTVPAHTSVDEIGDLREVLPDGGVGARSLVLTGAQGTIILDVVWSPSVVDVLDEVAAAALKNAERRQGVACLDPAGAIVVQRSSLSGGDVEDALDRALEMARPEDPWSIVLWTTAYAATGRAELLQRAEEASEVLPLVPGCGLAAMQLALARLTLGIDAATSHILLSRLARQVGDAATALELAVVGARIATPIDDLARVAVSELGAGLPGRPSRLTAVEIARRVAILRLSATAQAPSSTGEPRIRPPLLGPERVGALVQSWMRRLLTEQSTAQVLVWLLTAPEA